MPSYRTMWEVRLLGGLSAAAGMRSFRRQWMKVPMHGAKVLARVDNKVKVLTVDGISMWFEYHRRSFGG